MSTIVAKSAAAFTRNLKNLAEKVGDNYELAMKKGILDLYARIAQYTPADTGRARASWQVDVNLNKSSESESFDESSVDKNKRGMSIVDMNAEEFSSNYYGGTAYIFNNLEYILALEDGHSDQAPIGMTKLALTEFNEHFDSIVRELKLWG